MGTSQPGVSKAWRAVLCTSVIQYISKYWNNEDFISYQAQTEQALLFQKCLWCGSPPPPAGSSRSWSSWPRCPRGSEQVCEAYASPLPLSPWPRIRSWSGRTHTATLSAPLYTLEAAGCQNEPKAASNWLGLGAICGESKMVCLGWVVLS